MSRLFLAGQFLLLFVQTVLATSANCPDPLFLTESQLDPWVGVSVDTEQTQRTIVNGLNFLKCDGDSLFVYIANGKLTRANWFLACDDKAKNGWRVRDAGKKNTNYGLKPVGCAKPTHDIQVFDGTEYVLGSYPTYQIVPTKPSLVTNGKFQYTCLSGSTLGFASSATQITLDAKAKISCESDGWWIKTSTDSAGRLLSDAKVGCFKTITAPELPAQCQSGLNYFAGDEQLLKDASSYTWSEQKTAAVNGEWKLICPAGASIGYQEAATTFIYSLKSTVFCGAAGWMLTTPDSPDGAALSGKKVGCFTKKAFIPSANCPALSMLTQSHLAPWFGVVVDAAEISVVDTVNQLECKAGARFAYLTESNQTNLWSFDSWMDCDNSANAGWQMQDAEGKAKPYKDMLVGCIKPSCTELLLFDGSELVVAANSASYDWLPTYPSFPGGRFELVCPSGSGIGYVSAAGKFTFDPTMRISCTSLDWWVSSPSKQGRLSPTTRVGCFRKVSA